MTVMPPEKSYLSVEEKRIPLDIALLIAYLKENGHKVSFIDNYLKNYDWQVLIKKETPDFVGLFLSQNCLANAMEYIEDLKTFNKPENKTFKLIAFGPYAIFNAAKIPEYIDYIVTGDFENAFLEIFSGSIEERIVNSRPRSNIEDLKMPAYEFFIPHDNPYECVYDLTDKSLGDIFPVFDLLTVRGTQNQITYLPFKDPQECPLELMSPEKILQNVLQLVNKYDAKGIRFLDYDLSTDKDRLINLCNSIISSQIKVRWSCNLKPGIVDHEMLLLMKSAGCEAINIEYVTAVQKLLDSLNAGYKVEDLIQLVQNARNISIKVTLNVIYGLPDETEADRKQIETLLEQLAPDFLNILVFTGIPGSKLCEKAQNAPHRVDDNGLVIPFQWENLMNKYLKKPAFSGSYRSVPLASNPIDSVVFYKKDKYIQEMLEYIDSIPLKQKIYFYGAGKLAKSFVKKYKVEEYNVKGFIDNDLAKGGRFRPTKFKVYHETEIKKLAPDYIFITMASKSDSILVKEAIMNNIDLDRKPEVKSMFYEDV